MTAALVIQKSNSETGSESSDNNAFEIEIIAHMCFTIISHLNRSCLALLEDAIY